MSVNVNVVDSLFTVDNRSFEKIPIDFHDVVEVFVKLGFTQQIDITLLSRSQIQLVNYQLCSKNYPPDTLSFPPEKIEEPAVVLLCPREINLYCALNQIPLKVRWTHLVVHSILHTYGYDHHDDDDFRKMLSLERQILSHIKAFQPYELSDTYTYYLSL